MIVERDAKNQLRVFSSLKQREVFYSMHPTLRLEVEPNTDGVPKRPDFNMTGKFQVTEVTFYSHYEGVLLKLHPVGDSDLDEDKKFHIFTPNGELTMHVTNPAIYEKILANIGEYKNKKFYLNFIEAK